jgi:hypothetical protein
MIVVFFLIGLIYKVLYSFLDLIPVYSEGNIVNHIPTKHKLSRCCLRCGMIYASNISVAMQFIGGSNQADYLILLLYFHDCFPNWKIWAYERKFWKLSQLLPFCVWMIVTCYMGHLNVLLDFHECFSNWKVWAYER